MYKIMIVEDDVTIAKLIKEHLCKWSYNVVFVEDFKNIITQVVHFDPQLILMDIILPYYDGFYWCNEIRKISKVPIIFISSANENMNIVMAINMGGDDFISKPFDLNVLTAKVGALIRRTYAFQGTANIIEHNGAILNLNDATFKYKNNKIELTKNDFRILKLLMENAGKAVSREEIMQYLWESDEYVDDNTLAVCIARLRRKLAEAGVEDFILTKKGIGYMVE